MRCPKCNSIKLYKLKSKQLKCSTCRAKFSPARIHRDLSVIKIFCDNFTINQASIKLGLNYVTIKNRYEIFRKLVANFLEDKYQDKKVIEYDEYIYLEKSKKKIDENIFDAQNFLTFHYKDKIYNLLMPNLNRYKNQFLSDGMDKAYFNEFSKFMMLNKIAKIQNRENLITKFWIFFEKSITKYKGIKNDNFFYYLKEIEFKFNYTKEEQENILKNLYM
ncbi:MAG: IS1595 family transposase [Epsilonproteobacteria bacterium]|nr:IS1595 family transposase [Campylobacterota bacterium]